ncbi:MAG: hypothetical protein AAGH53_09305 [Pseudomonadota bacterium]
MLKPVAIVAGIFLVIVALIAGSLPVNTGDIAAENAVSADIAKSDNGPKPFVEKPVEERSVKKVSNIDIEGSGADSEQADGSLFVEEYDINPFSAEPIDSFGNDSVDVEPNPTIAENSVDHDIEADQLKAASSLEPGTGPARGVVNQKPKPPLKSEIRM